MSAPAGVTTVAEAAQWVWNQSNSALAQNTPASGIKERHFKTLPLARVKTIACADLRAFQAEWAALQKTHNVKVNTPAAAARGEASTAQLIYEHMSAQFTKWNKTCDPETRGAWWGSNGRAARPGQRRFRQKKSRR